MAAGKRRRLRGCAAWCRRRPGISPRTPECGAADPISVGLGIDSRGPAPRLRRPDLRRLAAPDRARRLRRRQRHAAARAPVPVHGRLGPDPFLRATRARLAAAAARGPADPDRRRRRPRRAPPPWSRFPAPGARAGRGQGRGRPLFGRARAALPVREFRRRQGQRGRLQRRADARDGREGRLQPAVPPRRHRPRQDPLAPRHRPRVPSPAAAGEDHLHVGREVHGRVRRRASRQRDHPVQAAAALRRPADDRRRPVHRRQGIRPRKNSSTR